MCDENYSIFSTTKEILTKFNDLNDAAQNMNFSFQKSNYSISYIKEMNEKLSKDMKKLEEQNEEIKNNNKEIKNQMDNLIKENQELKRKYS